MKTESKTYLQSKIKSRGTAYLMWFFLGFHHAYIGNLGRQLLFIFMPLIVLFLFFGGIVGESSGSTGYGIALLITAGLWYFIDLFLIPGYVNSKNRKLIVEIDEIEKRERLELASLISYRQYNK